jgi:hypothetical protein
MTQQPVITVDASTFQKPLQKLAEVLSQKVKREAPKLLSAPNFVAFDLHVLIRQAQHTYDLMFYLNTDERREKDSYWRPAYSVVALPLVRNMIDCLYNITNITAILQNPGLHGPRFRKYGYKKLLAGLDEDQTNYGGKPEWDEWIAKGRTEIDFEIRRQGFNQADILAVTDWPTLGQYINRLQKGGTLTPHQLFLKTLVYGPWREYSALAHGSAEGLLKTAIYYIADSVPHEHRAKLDDAFPRLQSLHISQAAGILICIVTELQAYFHFDGANINERSHAIWTALMPAFAVKELYSERYEQLMKDQGI